MFFFFFFLLNSISNFHLWVVTKFWQYCTNWDIDVVVFLIYFNSDFENSFPLKHWIALFISLNDWKLSLTVCNLKWTFCFITKNFIIIVIIFNIVFNTSLSCYLWTISLHIFLIIKVILQYTIFINRYFYLLVL